jgi:flagellar basal-body rod modification protein FlgD
MAVTVDQLQAIGRPDAVAEANAKKKASDAIGDRFLKLLVTQMRNQDPLNPLENAEVTSQLAQISTVTGVDKLNATMEALSQVITSTQTLQATTMVGRGVLAPGKALELGADGAIGAMDLKDAATLVNIEIFDKDNKSVRSMQLENRPAGLSSFVWNGKDNNEKALKAEEPYTFTINAITNGRKVEAQSYAQSQVQSVSLGGAEMIINTRSLGSMSMSEVKQIY